ncbi:MAG: nucleotidyltransferase family protein [Rhodospirillaceae bacterium]|nr:nucleotidyltransferase family protein [Rhodospirillaceae bacterium]
MIKTAVILCGGRGRRLGSVGETRPKAMVEVIGYPILWYSIMSLYAAGVRHFILPLGYRGDQIQGYVDSTFSSLNARIDAINTGEESPIGKRIHMVQHLLHDEPFLLVNGDCIYDLDLNNLYQTHLGAGAMATLAACRVTSQYGLIVVRNDRVVSFSRDSAVRAFCIDDPEQDGELLGYVNAGITILNPESLTEIDLLKTENFERDLFPRLIAHGRVEYYPIDRYWFAVETQKDLDIINNTKSGDPRATGAAQLRDALLQQQALLDLGCSL